MIEAVKLQVFCFVQEKHAAHEWVFKNLLRVCDGMGEVQLPPQRFEFCGSEMKHKAHRHVNDALCWGEPHQKKESE